VLSLEERRCPVIAVIGGGFCGTVTAVHVLRRAAPGTRVLVIERTGDIGPGRAYATADDRHLLNVPAARMSAFGDAPEDFVEWAGVAAAAYVPRRLYGEYLRSLLAEAAARSLARLERVAGEVVRLRRLRSGFELRLSDGRAMICDRVVLALGWPRADVSCELPDDERVVLDPWRSDALAGAASALVIGTGPTAVDVALTLCARPASGPVTAVSRGGRLPFAQLPGLRSAAPPPALAPGAAPLEALERTLRRHIGRMQADGYDWRDAIDGIRPLVPELWSRLSPDDRRRFIHTRARAWEVRRHRLAPQVARTVEALRSSGRLEVVAGGLARARLRRGRLEVRLGNGRVLRPDRVVACTGAGEDIRTSPDRLVRALLTDGLAMCDALGLGLRAAPGGALLDARRKAQPAVWVLGPLRRGDLWESTAVRELRDQAAVVGAAVSASLAPTQRIPEAVPA
jgi:uncharacterized NAD(P)/FAD-binding protein YdhS